MTSRPERGGSFTSNRGSGKRGSSGRIGSYYSNRVPNSDSSVSRRDYEGDYHPRQKSNSGRGHHGSPDRRHGDRSMSGHHSHFGGKQNSGSRGGSGPEDPQLSTLWSKLESAQDADQCHRVAQQIQSLAEQPDNKQIVSRLSEPGFSAIDRVLVEWDNRGLRETLSRVIGCIGIAVGANSHRFFTWVLGRSNASSSGDIHTKAVYLTGLHHTLSTDAEHSTFAKSIPSTLDKLQHYLEAVESPVLLKPLVNCLVEISKNYRQHFGHHFKNTVDILVGWHIDTSQDSSLIDFVSGALQSFSMYWSNDMQFTLDLMNQFLEDMDAYSEEMAGGDGELSQDQISPPEVCMSKLIVLLRVFTTVLLGLGECFSPSRGYGITLEYITGVILRLLKSVGKSNSCLYSEELLITGNYCFHALSKSLDLHMLASAELMLEFVLKQFDDTDAYSEDHTHSATQLVLLMAETLQANLPLSFIQRILAGDSPILQFRYSASQKLMDTLVKLYQTLFAIRKVPILDTCYQLVNADLDTAMKDLLRVNDSLSTLPPSSSSSSTTTAAGVGEGSKEGVGVSHHRNLSPYEAQGAVIFDVAILSQLLATTKSTMGMWMPKPSLHTLVTSHLATLNPLLACEYPAVHYALLHTLYQECHSHGYYIPGALSPVTYGNKPLLLADPNASGSLSEIVLLLTKQLELYTLNTDICCLLLKWFEDLVELLVGSRDPQVVEDCKPQLASLALQLISFTFSREHSIRLETASLFKSLVQNRLLSNAVTESCVPEFLMRLTDTKGEIRAAYSTLLEVVPTAVITSFAKGIDVPTPKSGRKGLEALRSSYGTWLARKSHMTRTSQATFHGHHFKAIMGFILQGYAPSKHLSDDWLERVFHSCQHRQPQVSSTYENPECHPLLMAHMVGNCDAVLWHWAIYESAQYCVMARLRTPLGAPADTFQVIETVLCGFAQEVEHQKTGKQIRDGPSSFSGHMGAGLGPRHYTVHLRTALVLHFMENLERLMYNAYEGVSPMIYPTAPKPVRSFFRMNRATCKEWLGRIRGYLVTIGNHAGMPAIAVRNGFEALYDLKSQTKSLEFWTMLVSVVKGLVALGSWEAIKGIGVWCQLMLGTKPVWIQGAEAQARGSYELACEEYTKALGLLHPSEEEEGDDRGRAVRASQLVIVEFVVNEMCECYGKARDWREVVSWDTRVEAMKKQHSDMESAFRLHCDIEQIKALSCYDTRDFAPAREFLETQDVRRDPEVFPMWDPSQLLNASKTLLLKSVVPQGGGEGSGSDETLSASDETEFGSKSTIRRWLKLASAFTESPIRVKALDWPLHISPPHALQLQVTAALKALGPVKPRSQGSSQSGLVLHTVDSKSLDPSTQDGGVWNDTLRYLSFLQHAPPRGPAPSPSPAPSSSPQLSSDQLSRTLLETIRLARRQENYKLTKILLRRHILGLTQDASLSPDTDLPTCVLRLNGSPSVPAEEKMKVMREVSKLSAVSGQLPQAIETLTDCVASFSAGLTDPAAKHSGTMAAIRRGSPEGNELVSRSLLSVVKWLQTDTRLLQTIWKGDNPVMANLQTLLHMEEEVRSEGIGLFDSDQDSWDLFAPEESKYERHEFAMGQLLHLSAVHAPALAKAWWNLAGWCYRIGRKHLEAVSSSGTADLKEHERKSVASVVPLTVSTEECQAVYRVLGQVHAADDSGDDFKEAVRHNQEDELNVIRRQLLLVCPALERMPTLDGLICIWQGVRNRVFKHYQLATRAYFKFLHLSGSHPDDTPGVDDMNVTATLRLLRLLVKYAIELKSELEVGFADTPTKPWKGIIPQLFSRLNHPDANVRQSVLDLLCRVGTDTPHYVIYHAVVGIMKRNSTDKRTGMSGLLDDTSGDANFDSGVGAEVGVDMYSPPDTPVSVEGEHSEQGSAEGEEQSATSLEKCHQAIVDSLCVHSGGVVSEVRALVTELCRVTLLWDEMWLAALQQRQGEVYRRLQQIESEARRTATLSFLSPEEKQAVLKKKYDATMKPLIWLLEHLQAVTSQSPETHNERIFQATYQDIISNAIHTLKHPPSYTNPHPSWEPFKEFQQMLMMRSQKRMTSAISLHEVSPHLAAITSSSITLPGLENIADEPIVLENFDLDISVLPTKTKPKKISMMGSDGRRHTYLFKGLEDLHLDERVMQFMAIINNMFVRDLKHQKQVYRARDYTVTPLGARSGLIQWIDSATPLFGLYKRWQQREAYANAQMKQSGHDGGQPVQVQILKPNELFYSKIIPELKKHGMTEAAPRKDWPRDVQRKVLQELIRETPRDLLARELWAASTCATEWWHVTQNYTRSTAVMSIIGYIIGLGDRHLDNLLVEFASGQVIHVDYNVCFEKGKSLRVPEKVPFRMTQNIEAACGFTGVEGLFRTACEEILRILRHGRETLLTLLEAFVYDPLIDWTHSEEAAFPLAIKSPELTGLQTRKEMECEVAEGLLVTRLCEMSPHWERCKDSLVAVMRQLEEDLGGIAGLGRSLAEYRQELTSLDKQVEVLQEALHTPNHPLISMQDRLTEQNRLKSDYERVMTALREKYKETSDWQNKHETAFQLMHSAEFQELCSKLHRPPDIGSAGYEIASDFLLSSGQGRTVELCRQLDQELSGQLQRRRALLNTCLEALLTYRSVTAHYPAHYPGENRSQAWATALSRIFEGESLSPDDFQQAITDFEIALTPSAVPKCALAVNAKLRKYIQDMYARANKLGERLRSLNSQDLSSLEETVQESMAVMKRFFQESGQPGAVSMVCFLVMAVSPLIRRWLYMEQTAHAANERLSDLTSKDGDWFLDELCTMSGNVSQIVVVMETCMETIAQAPIKETSLLSCSMLALHEVHRVYSALQDLMGSYQLEVLPRALDLLLSEDGHFAGKMDQVLSVKVEGHHGDPSLRGLMVRIMGQLKTSAMKDCSLDAAVTAALKDLKTQFKVIFALDPPPEEAPPPGLRVFADLVQSLDRIEDMCAYLFTTLDRIAAPVEWACVDLFKEAEGLLFSAPGAVLYVELFFLRKAIAVWDVCFELSMLRRAYKVDLPEDGDVPSLTPPTPPQSPILGPGLPPTHVPSESHLAQPIRRYISDTLTTHLLGQPTHTLSCITLSILHQLGAAVENRPTVMDELCRMAHDQCQPASTAPVLHQARQLYSNSDLAWREWDKAKRLMQNLKVHREAMGRFNQLTTCFQWLHEEALSQPDSGHQWVGPQRSTTLIPLKRASGDQIISSVASVREKVQSQHFRISQRLQWAAGANPGLNLIFDDFERAVNSRNKALQVEEDLCSEIIDLCRTVIHLESTHSRTVIKTAYDKEVILLLSKGAEVFAQLSQCNEHLDKVSDIVPLIALPLSEPVTMSWMSSRLDELNARRNRMVKDKKDANHKMTKCKESVLSDLEKLKGQNRHYKKLMLEIWHQLTTLGKLDPPLPPGQLSPGPRTCITVQNRLSEGTRQLIQVTHELIAADLSLAKPSMMDPASIDKYTTLQDTTSNLRQLLEWLLDQLSSFVSQLYSSQQPQPQQQSQFLPWAELPPRLAEVVVKHEKKEDKPYHVPHGVFRDPRTGKALQQQNTHAVGVWRRVKAKLDGRDFDNAYRMSVTEQVDYVIQEAISPDNLCELYEGWTPWV